MRNQNVRSKALFLCIGIGIILLAIYVVGFMISDDSITGSILDAKQPPSQSYWFGTDAVGRNLFLRTIKGMSISMTVGFFASLVSAIIATLIGMSAVTGWRWLDHIVTWVIDLVMGVPHTILVILISFVMGRGMLGLFIGIAATHWCSLARLIRAEVLQLREAHYISASRKFGKSYGWILFHHVLPHVIPQFIVGLIVLFPHAILHEAAISFLGFGLPPEQPAIGIILSESMRYLSTGMWWSAVLPGAFLVIIVLLIDQLGEYARLLLDPMSAQE